MGLSAPLLAGHVQHQAADPGYEPVGSKAPSVAIASREPDGRTTVDAAAMRGVIGQLLQPNTPPLRDALQPPPLELAAHW